MPEDPQTSRVEADGGVPRLATALRRHWHVPALVGAAGLLVAGIVQAFATAETPDFAGPLRTAETLIERTEYERAIEVLNADVFPYLGQPLLPRRDRARFHTLMARALYGGQRALEAPHPDNDRNAIAQFLEAEKNGETLVSADVAKLVRSYLAVGDVAAASERIGALETPEQGVRDALRRDIVMHHLAQRPPDYDAALGAVADLLADPGVEPGTRVWALEEQARIRIELGYAEQAVTQLLRELPLLIGRKDANLSSLRLALGRGYLMLGAIDEADRELALVDRDDAAAAGTEERGEAVLLRGQVAARRVDDPAALELSRDRFQQVVDLYTGARVFHEALLGLADAEADLGNADGAVEAFGALIGALTGPTPPARPTRGQVTDRLMARYDRETAAQSWSQALRYASLASELWSLEETPPRVLAAMGHAHEASAGAIAASVERAGPASSAALDPGTALQIKRHLLQSASYFNAHADRFLIDDIATHRDSLWKSAQLFDRAGDKAQAIRAYQDFLIVSEGDPRHAESKFRLGQVQQARGEYEAAGAIYRELIEARRDGGIVEVGPWAEASLVPLAQCYLADLRDENDADAEQVLLTALSGETGGPGRPAYAEALTELGRLYYRQGRYALAMERLDEARARAMQEGREVGAGTSYLIADTHRQIAGQIDQRLTLALREGERRVLLDERERHLRTAMELFAQVRDALLPVDERRLTSLEAVNLRNAMFYLGDCAFDLGDMQAAVGHYTAARRRYEQDPASLVALMQIVNAYLDMGDVKSARAANERAKDFLRSLPDDVWDDPTLPIRRQDWQKWLDANTALYQRVASGGD